MPHPDRTDPVALALKRQELSPKNARRVVVAHLTLYEIDGLRPEDQAALNAGEFRETMLNAGKKWVRVFAEDELSENDWWVLDIEDLEVVVVRLDDGYHAFNNACPHLHILLYERRALAGGARLLRGWLRTAASLQHDHPRSRHRLPLAPQLFRSADR
jgi:hypothetical protein